MVVAGLAACEANNPEPANTENNAPASTGFTFASRLNSASIVVADMDRSIAFYEDILGYKLLGRRIVEEEKSLQVLGASGEAKVEYAALVPEGWKRENPNASGIGLVYIPDAQGAHYDSNAERRSRVGELILAHRVSHIEDIHAKVVARNIPIVAPLSKSGSGRSTSMSILDPDGVRIEMYEY